jgi:hypothetical protein
MAPRRRWGLGLTHDEAFLIRMVDPTPPDGAPAWITDPARGGFPDFYNRWHLYGAEVLREAAMDNDAADFIPKLIAAYGCPEGWPQ